MALGLANHADALSLCTAGERFLGCALAPKEWLAGGDEALVLRAVSADRSFVLHANPGRLSRDELAWSHAVSRHAARTVAEAIAPIERAGATLIEWRDFHLAIYPFVEGSLVDRADPAMQLAAARMLARLHRALLDWTGGPRPAALHPLSAVAIPSDLVDESLDDWWHAAEATALTGVIHGDYYQRNLLRHGRNIVGVIDWHDAALAPLALELAGAAFEFSRDAEHGLDFRKAHDFVRAYRAGGGPVPDREVSALVPYMRQWLKRDVTMNLLCGTAGDDPYIARQVAAFQRLAACDWDGQGELR